MTSIQLAHRCARLLTERDLTRLPANVLLEILDAINAGLQIVYSLLPENMRETTVSETLRAPETVAIEFTERYKNVTLNYPFTNAMRGCTTRICDDAADNEVVATNAVLDQYLGQSLTGNATVYHDCVPLYAVIDKIKSAVRLYDGASCIAELARNQRLRSIASARQIGTPRQYILESVGSSQNSDPAALLRVHPMPERDLRIRFECTLATVRVTFAQVSRDAVNLPVPDQLCESALVPITQAQLTDCKLWADPATKTSIEEKAQAAVAMLRRQPHDIGPGGNTVSTEEGF